LNILEEGGHKEARVLRAEGERNRPRLYALILF